MCRKLFYLTSVIVLLGMVGSLSATCATVHRLFFDGNDAANYLWTDGNNWSWNEEDGSEHGTYWPDGGWEPNQCDRTYTFGDQPGPIIQAGMDAVCANLKSGISFGTGDPNDPCEGKHPGASTFTITGGTFTLGQVDNDGYWQAGYGGIGDGNQTAETITISGGTINIYNGAFDLGNRGSASCTYTNAVMNAGGLVAGTSDANDFGLLDLQSGIINLTSLDPNDHTLPGFSIHAENGLVKITAGTITITDGVDTTKDPDRYRDRRDVVAADINDNVLQGWSGAVYHSRYVQVDFDNNTRDMTITSDSTRNVLAYHPTPVDWKGVYLEDVATNTVTLEWMPGDGATSHVIYFSANYEDVKNRVGGVEQPGTSYTVPEALALETTYYWLVEEKPSGVGRGDIWRFTTSGKCIPVDSFGTYLDTGYPTPVICDPNFLRCVWIDGVDLVDSGAFVELSTSGYDDDEAFDDPCERGDQAMLMYYNNDGSVTYPEVYSPPTGVSKVYRVPANSDWTRGGVQMLSLMIRGDAGNAPDELYVNLEDGGGAGTAQIFYDFNDVTGLYNDFTSDENSPNYHDADAHLNEITTTFWQEWNIDLDLFGVQLNNVQKIIIGVGRQTPQAGGKGEVLIDRIRLCKPRCLLELQDYDLSGDCVVNFDDVAILAKRWLFNGVFPPQ